MATKNSKTAAPQIVLFRIEARRRTRAIAAQCQLAMVGPGLYCGPLDAEDAIKEKIAKYNEKAIAKAEEAEGDEAASLAEYSVIDPNAMAEFYEANKPERKAPRRERVQALLKSLEGSKTELPAEVASLLDELDL